MALLSIRQVSDDIILGLWKIEETSASLFHNFCFLEKYRNSFSDLYKSEKRLCEVLAVRVLVHELLGTDVALSHYANGAPRLGNGMNIGISHTKGYAAVIISKQYRVSVDIERISNRVSRITDKFLRPDEKADTVIEQLLHWCTKETLYKLYPEDDLKFEEMKVSDIDGNETEGIIKAKNIKHEEKVDVRYHISDNYVLTFAFL
ncbi:MAG: 4'-phosphopantetheinyl transferase superfamily protein [Prevotella sp.]|nr:4'-phosphopantetheinyl transferase superfamily protein [Prevotella sp.]